jgi:succinyl-CoA synthetase beta subunit
MNIHEYQARELFEKFGVATTKGGVANSAEEAAAVATKLGTKEFMVKAQIHAGGRGKGTFTSGFKGGVHMAKSVDQVREFAGRMLGQTLVTHQTGPEGKVVSKVLIAAPATIARELYFAILLDRASSAPVVIASTEGGMDIEHVAEHTPEKIFRDPIHPVLGLQPYQTRKLAKALGLSGAQIAAAAKLFTAMFKLFMARDCSQIEVNPLVVTETGELLALDAKFNFDDNALYRQPEIVAMRDKSEEDPREVAASEFNLNYIGQFAGGKPANFLDVGGGATKEQVTAAFKIILSDPRVEGILVNIFGGIMDCDIIAHGILAAAKETSLSIPLVVRLEGNNVAAGKATLAGSGLAVIPADDLADAAKKIVAAVKSAA